MSEDLASVSTEVLRQRVNARLGSRHDHSYISRVKHGRAGSPSLRDVVRQEMAKILDEAAAAARAPEASAP